LAFHQNTTYDICKARRRRTFKHIKWLLRRAASDECISHCTHYPAQLHTLKFFKWISWWGEQKNKAFYRFVLSMKQYLVGIKIALEKSQTFSQFSNNSLNVTHSAIVNYAYIFNLLFSRFSLYDKVYKSLQHQRSHHV
jgi:hypothetical protein